MVDFVKVLSEDQEMRKVLAKIFHDLLHDVGVIYIEKSNGSTTTNKAKELDEESNKKMKVNEILL